METTMPRQSRSPAPRRSARQSGAAAPPPQPLPERGARAAQAAPRAAPVAAAQGANVQADQLEINRLQGNVLEAVKALVDAEKNITSRAPPQWNTIPNPCKDTISCLIQQTQSLVTGAGNSDVSVAFRNVRGKCIGNGVDVYSLCGNLLSRNEINAVAFMIDTLNELAVVMQIQGGLIGEIQTGRLRSNWRNEYPYRVWRYSTSRAVIATSAACLLGLLTTAVVHSYRLNQVPVTDDGAAIFQLSGNGWDPSVGYAYDGEDMIDITDAYGLEPVSCTIGAAYALICAANGDTQDCYRFLCRTIDGRTVLLTRLVRYVSQSWFQFFTRGAFDNMLEIAWNNNPGALIQQMVNDEDFRNAVMALNSPWAVGRLLMTTLGTAATVREGYRTSRNFWLGAPGNGAGGGGPGAGPQVGNGAAG